MAEEHSSQREAEGRSSLEGDGGQGREGRSPGALFAERPVERASSGLLPWGIAGLVVVLAIVVLVLVGRRDRGTAASGATNPDAYSASMVISGIQMSESTSLSGGKSTYIDGRIRNAGDKTVTSATVQVAFGNDEALPPQIETLPLALIRTHEPYVDTQPVGDAPLAPGDDREFRLIFEDIRANWNQQLPQIRVLRVRVR